MTSVIPAPWKTYSQRLLNIRTTVFVEEQGVPAEIEHDDLDEKSYHVLLVCDSSDVATGRLLDDGHIGRVCVLENFRGMGLGVLVIKSLILEASSRGMQEVLLSSQVQALEFYEKLGFEVSSEEYFEAGIPHVDMKLNI